MLAVRCFLLTSAKAKKFQDGDRSTRLYTTISLQPRRFSKMDTTVYQKDSRSFQQWVQKEAKRGILQDYEVTDIIYSLFLKEFVSDEQYILRGMGGVGEFSSAFTSLHTRD